LVCSWLVFAAEDEQTKWPTDLYPQIWSKRSLTVIPIALRTAIVKHTGVAIAHQMASERAAAGKR
jgi:hypothetical protein